MDPKPQSLTRFLFLDEYAITTVHQPTLLYRADPLTTRMNRVEALRDLPPAPPGSGLSRDEYPFASSYQGGAGATVGYVPAFENWSQGGQLSFFYLANGVVPGDPYGVQLVPRPPKI